MFQLIKETETLRLFGVPAKGIIMLNFNLQCKFYFIRKCCEKSIIKIIYFRSSTGEMGEDISPNVKCIDYTYILYLNALEKDSPIPVLQYK